MYLERVEDTKEPCEDGGVVINSQQPKDPGKSQEG